MVNLRSFLDEKSLILKQENNQFGQNNADRIFTRVEIEKIREQIKAINIEIKNGEKQS